MQGFLNTSSSSALTATNNIVDSLQQAAAVQQATQRYDHSPALQPRALPLVAPGAQVPMIRQVVAYTGNDRLGYGQVNGFEFLLSSGCCVRHGRCKGRAETLKLREGEGIMRIAGRVDLGRRQRGAAPSSPDGCLVSLQFTTSCAREAVFGLVDRVRVPSHFMFRAMAGHSFVAVQARAPPARAHALACPPQSAY